MDLYLKTSLGCSQVITRNYSTSFSAAIKALSRRFHDPIYGVYGFVRLADEIVDTFHGHEQERMLNELRADTWRALDEGISLNPVLHAFQDVVRKYKIERELIEAFLKSMEMDLYISTYGPEKFDEYVYGSAEVVGLMCLRIFTEGNEELYQKLTPTARKLGAAFQKINFLRDVQADYLERGRIYFPGVEWKSFSSLDKDRIEKEIELDFQEAYQGILQLPRSARMGVYLAYVYYKSLFRKIRKLPASRILQERIRIGGNQKLALLVGSYVRNQINLL